MSEFKPRPGTFLPYMESRNQRLAQRAAASPLTLLEILTRQAQRSLPLFELQAQSGMDPSRYAAALKGLRGIPAISRSKAKLPSKWSG